MSKKYTTITIEIDDKLKQQAEELFASRGMDLSTAINLFLAKCVEVGGIPFMTTTEIPNEETIAAMEEARHLTAENSKSYNSVEELLEDLMK